MAGEWIDTTLGEVTDFLSGGTPSKDRPDYWVGSVPWVSAKDMKRFRLDDSEDHVSEGGVANGTRLTAVDSRIEAIELETRTLAALRDTLLPKLISGELRVREVERLVEKGAR